MLNMKICGALVVLVLCVIGNAQAVNKLADVYVSLPADIKPIIDKYRDQSATINYDNFLFNLTEAAGFANFKTTLDIMEDPYPKTSLETLFKEYLMDIMTSPMTNEATTTTVAPVKLADVYDKLPSDTKAVFDKYKDQTTTIDYDAFLTELKNTGGYDNLLNELKIQGEFTADNLEMLYAAYRNNAVRNGVTMGSVVMVSVMSMLIAYLN